MSPGSNLRHVRVCVLVCLSLSRGVSFMWYMGVREFLLLFAMKSLPFLPRIDNELEDMLGGGVEVATEMDGSGKRGK